MKQNLPLSKLIALALALLALTATARADAEDKITKSFAIEPGGQFVLQVDRGSIEVRTADNNSVDIEVTRKAGGNQSKAEQTLKDHIVTTTKTGNKVELTAKYNGPKSSGWFGGSPELQVSYVIVVPRKFDVDLRTAGGHIKIAELTGKLKANTSGGNLNFEKIEGPVSAQTSGGHIILAGAKGKVDLKTSGGNLTLSDIEGDVNATTSGGHIKAHKVTGKTVVKTSGGNIEVIGINGSVDTDTSGGHITAQLLTQPTGDCSFETSGGNITIALAEKLAVEVNLRTGGGRVSSDLPVMSVVQGEQKRNELRGKINGGGPLLTARTSGGHVRIETASSKTVGLK